jgi:hypothetical protein
MEVMLEILQQKELFGLRLQLKVLMEKMVYLLSGNFKDHGKDFQQYMKLEI